jgi:hypothetical protein
MFDHVCPAILLAAVKEELLIGSEEEIEISSVMCGPIFRHPKLDSPLRFQHVEALSQKVC